MRKMMQLLMAGAVLMTAGACYAVEPAYRGPLGNPEEPALRPYKWLWSGARALVHQTKSALVRGNMNTPVIGTVEGLRGLGIGTVELGESAYRGAVFAPVPRDNRFLTTHKANQVLEEDPLLRNTRDVASSLVFYPALKALDRYPLESDEKVEARLDKAAETREARKEAEANRSTEAETQAGFKKSSVRKAQERYIGGRVPFSGTDGRAPARDLTKRAR